MKGGFDMTIALVISLMVGIVVVLLMMNYLNADVVREETSGYSQQLEGNAGAYFAMKIQCVAWGQHIANCPNENCEGCSNCENEFVNKWNKYYEIPWHLYSSGLVIVDENGELIANPRTYHCGGTDGRTEGAPCYNAVRCVEALKFILCEAGEDCGEKLRTIDYGSAASIMREKIESGSATTMKRDFAPYCAMVCKTVKNKADNCGISVQQCANEAVGWTFP